MIARLGVTDRTREIHIFCRTGAGGASLSVALPGLPSDAPPAAQMQHGEGQYLGHEPSADPRHLTSVSLLLELFTELACTCGPAQLPHPYHAPRSFVAARTSTGMVIFL